MSKSKSKQLSKQGPSSVAIVDLTTKQLELAYLLAREGNREHTIRRALDLSPKQWKAMREEIGEDGELSPLSQALCDGISDGCGEIISFMKSRMIQDRDIRAAEWLASNVFQINKSDGNNEGAKIMIQINQAMTIDQYEKSLSTTIYETEKEIGNDNIN